MRKTKDLCRRPVFIIGSPRSGTSVVPWALAHHRELWTSRESNILWDLYGDGRAEDVYRRAIEHESWITEQQVDRGEFLRRLGTGVNSLYTSRSEGRRWIDQTPVHTLMVETLAEMFPDAQFIHVMRDGRRVVDSMVHFGGHVPTADSADAPRWMQSFEMACTTWVDYVSRAHGFAAKNPERVLEVVNERLAQAPEEGFTTIQRFLGVKVRPGPARFMRSSRINSSFAPTSWGAGLSPVDDPPHLRRPWVEWTDAQRATFSRLALPTLRRFGFVAVDEDDCLHV